MMSAANVHPQEPSPALPEWFANPVLRRHVSAATSCCDRTLRAYVLGGPVRHATAARIDAALLALNHTPRPRPVLRPLAAPLADVVRPATGR